MMTHACGISTRLSFVYEMNGPHKAGTRKHFTRLSKAEQTQNLKHTKAGGWAGAKMEKIGDRQAMLAHFGAKLAAAEPSASNLAALADAQIGAKSKQRCGDNPRKTSGNPRPGLPPTRAGYLERLGNIEISRGNTKLSRKSLFLVEALSHVLQLNRPSGLAPSG